MLLAQITDLHIKPEGRLAYRQVDTARCLERAVAALRALVPAPDAVLVTGDLVDAGRADEYGLLREILASLTLPLFVLPGNHDARATMRAAFADHSHLGSDGPMHYQVDVAGWRILALDSLVEGESFGRLGAAQLDWLDRTLRDAPDHPTLVAVHHPPFVSGIGHMDRIGLEDRQMLEAVIRRHGQVERILSGHVHRAMETRFAGTIASTAPSTAHAVALDIRPDAPSAFQLEPPGYQLHWTSPSGGLVTHTAAIGPWPGPFAFFKDGVLID